MKTIRITYWISTSIVSLMMLFSVYAYFTLPSADQGFHHLGYPTYFKVELAIAKFIGVIVLLAPVSSRLKEWAYAGFTIVFISALIAHTVSGDPVIARLSPVIILVLLLVSYITYHKSKRQIHHIAEKRVILSPNAQ